MGHPLALGTGLDRAPARHRAWLSPLGAALATLAVILASGIVAQGGVGVPLPEDPRLQLTDLGRRALDELPLAYQVEDTVVVPAAADESIAWPRRVPTGWVAGPALPLGTRGLLPYERLVDPTRSPDWTGGLSGEDRVFADVGPLWLGCVAWPGSSGCSPTALMLHEGDFHAFASHFGPFDGRWSQPMSAVSFDALGGAQVGKVLVGGTTRAEVRQVAVTLADRSQQPAWTTSALGGRATMWWATVWQPVAAVTAYDSDGLVVAEVALSGP